PVSHALPPDVSDALPISQLRVTMVLAVANCSLIGLQLTLQLALHPPVDATTMRVLSNCNWWPSISTVTAGSAECLDVSRAVTSTERKSTRLNPRHDQRAY